MAKQESALYVTAKEIIECYTETALKEAVLFCSIPHWFDENFIAVVNRDENTNLTIKKEILFLPFINEVLKGAYFYHDNIRTKLIKEIYATRYDDFIRWNKITISYYAWQVSEADHWRNLLEKDGLILEPVQLINTPVLVFDKKRCDLEIAYHLIAIDNDKWMPVIYSLFMMAYWYNDTKLCNIIFQMSNEIEFILTPFNRIINQYFMAVLLYSSSLSKNSLDILSKVNEEINAFPDTELKRRVGEDIREVIKKRKLSTD